MHVVGVKCSLFTANCRPLERIEFTSTRDLLEKMKASTIQHPTGIVIHAAAVGDFEVRNTNSGKISSGSSLTLELQPTPKIVDAIKTWSSKLGSCLKVAAAPNTPLQEVKQIAQQMPPTYSIGHGICKCTRQPS